MERRTPVRVHEVGLRPRGDAIGRLDRLVGSRTVGQVAPYCGHEVAGRLGRIVGQDADDREPVGGVLGELAPRAAGTRRGRGRSDGPQKLMTTGWPARLARSNVRAVEGRARIAGAGLPTADVRRPSGRRAAVPDEQHDRRRSSGRRRAGRAGSGGAASTCAGYWSVAVPVMLGWTMHLNVYSPAGRAGTW